MQVLVRGKHSGYGVASDSPWGYAPTMSYKPAALYMSGCIPSVSFWTVNIFENIEGYAPLVYTEFREGVAAWQSAIFMGIFGVG